MNLLGSVLKKSIRNRELSSLSFFGGEDLIKARRAVTKILFVPCFQLNELAPKRY